MGKAAPAPLSASLLGVPKGAAAPPADPPPTPPPPATEAVADVAPATPTPAEPRRQPPTVPPLVEEPKSALTVRLPLSTLERLREAAHRTRREKQAIVDEALISWLDWNEF